MMTEKGEVSREKVESSEENGGVECAKAKSRVVERVE